MDGTVLDYKLAWVDESDKKILHSKMFETLEAAINESVNHKDFFIFNLTSNENGAYSWVLLPYGMSTWYQAGLTLRDLTRLL